MYANVDEADNYFFNNGACKKWFEVQKSEKEKALEIATIKIDTLKLNGKKTNIDQTNEFPRNGTKNIPKEIIYATIEEAYEIIFDNNSERRNLIANGVSGFSVGELSESYNGCKPTSLIYSATAKEYLTKWIGGSYAI